MKNGKFLTWRGISHAVVQPGGQLARKQLCSKRLGILVDKKLNRNEQCALVAINGNKITMP